MPRIAFQGTRLSYKSWNFFNNVHNILRNYRIFFAAHLIYSSVCLKLNPRSRGQSKRFKNGLGNLAQVRCVWRSSCCKQPYAAHKKNLTLSISTRSTSRFIQTSASLIHMWHRQQTGRTHFLKNGCLWF